MFIFLGIHVYTQGMFIFLGMFYISRYVIHKISFFFCLMNRVYLEIKFNTFIKNIGMHKLYSFIPRNLQR